MMKVKALGTRLRRPQNLAGKEDGGRRERIVFGKS